MGLISLLQRQYRFRFDPARRESWIRHYSFPDEIEVQDHAVNFKLAGLTVPSERAFIFNGHYPLLRNLIQLSGAVFRASENGSFYCSIAGLEYYVETAEDIYILHEIFVEGDYNLVFPQGDTVVIDIGMNVGFTSLYFASRKDVSAVYGFEPFEKTHAQACRNIALNPSFSAKIRPNSYGLSDRQFTTEFDYDYNEKGRMGVLGVERLNRSVAYEKATVRFEEALGEVEKICNSHSRSNVVVKLDCEGSEYSILPNIARNGIHPAVKAVVIEWHEHGHRPLSDLLKEKGFSMHIIRPDSMHVGMIYAFRP